MAKKAKAKAENGETESTSTNPPSTKTGFGVFERANTSRSSLATHDHNPRSIDKHAFKKLKDGLKKHGLISALQVNRRRTANGFDESEEGRLIIIGGHQRCKAMDDIRGYPDKPDSDYPIPIDLVEVSPAKEIELLIALNNQGLQGQFDYDMLAELLTTPDIDPFAAGFDRADLNAMFDEGQLAEILGEDEKPSKDAVTTAPLVDMLNAYNVAGNEARKQSETNAAPLSPSDSPDAISPDATDLPSDQATEVEPTDSTDPANPAEAELTDRDLLVSRRKQYLERHGNDQTDDYMCTLVANSSQELRFMLTKLNLPSAQKTVSLSAFLDRLASFTETHAVKDLMLEE